VEDSFSPQRDVIGWRQSQTTGETFGEKVVLRQCARANNRLLAGDNPDIDPAIADNHMEMNREAEQKMLH
jgi:hypothetical protein